MIKLSKLYYLVVYLVIGIQNLFLYLFITFDNRWSSIACCFVYICFSAFIFQSLCNDLRNYVEKQEKTKAMPEKIKASQITIEKPVNQSLARPNLRIFPSEPE